MIDKTLAKPTIFFFLFFLSFFFSQDGTETGNAASSKGELSSGQDSFSFLVLRSDTREEGVQAICVWFSLGSLEIITTFDRDIGL